MHAVPKDSAKRGEKKPRFEIEKVDDGYRWTLFSEWDEPIVSSKEIYRRKDDCSASARLVAHYAPEADMPEEEVFQVGGRYA